MRLLAICIFVVGLTASALAQAPEGPGLAAADASSARWRWPWEVRHARHHRRHRVRTEKAPPVDCKQINEAVNSLPPDRLAKVMTRSNAKQRKTIADCSENSR